MSRLSLLTFLALTGSSNAVRAPLIGRIQGLNGWDGVVESGLYTDVEGFKLETTLSLNGVEQRVIVDTASADLFVTNDVESANDTTYEVYLEYQRGEVSGPIKTANLSLGGLDVPEQAFVKSSYILLDFNQGNKTEIPGILGLGPSGTSGIAQKLREEGWSEPTATRSAFARMLEANSTINPMFTFYVDRQLQYPDPPFIVGDLTIGEVLPSHSKILEQPKLVIDRREGKYWETLLDDDGFIGPDGRRPMLAKNASTSVVFDTGFAISQLPREYIDTIYKHIAGSKLVRYEKGNAIYWSRWLVPCAAEFNITLKFSGVSFTTHPLDSSIPIFDPASEDGKYCLGAFQELDPNLELMLPSYRMVLGTNFLRNAYLLVNVGRENVISETASGQNKTEEAYIQLLPLTTDHYLTHVEFYTTRDLYLRMENEDQEKAKAHHHHTLVIALSVPFSILGAALLGAGGVLLYKRRQSRSKIASKLADE